MGREWYDPGEPPGSGGHVGVEKWRREVHRIVRPPMWSARDKERCSR
eukprot:gene51903-23932_t